MIEAEVVWEIRSELGEGPIWWNDSLYWVDINAPLARLHACDGRQAITSTPIQDSRWKRSRCLSPKRPHVGLGARPSKNCTSRRPRSGRIAASLQAHPLAGSLFVCRPGAFRSPHDRMLSIVAGKVAHRSGTTIAAYPTEVHMMNNAKTHLLARYHTTVRAVCRRACSCRTDRCVKSKYSDDRGPLGALIRRFASPTADPACLNRSRRPKMLLSGDRKTKLPKNFTFVSIFVV